LPPADLERRFGTTHLLAQHVEVSMPGHRPLESSEYERDERIVREGFWPKITRTFSYIPFADKILAAYYCAMDPSTPFKVRATLLGALAYFILPFDVIPDIILGLGFTDDMAVIVTAFTMIRNHLTQEHLDRARDTIDRLRAGEAPART
jgi:uncharacterized membrane protein YkvA (DUF1232 family)